MRGAAYALTRPCEQERRGETDNDLPSLRSAPAQLIVYHDGPLLDGSPSKADSKPESPPGIREGTYRAMGIKRAHTRLIAPAFWLAGGPPLSRALGVCSMASAGGDCFGRSRVKTQLWPGRSRTRSSPPNAFAGLDVVHGVLLFANPSWRCVRWCFTQSSSSRLASSNARSTASRAVSDP